MTTSGQAMWIVMAGTSIAGALLWMKYLKNGGIRQGPARDLAWPRWGALDVLVAGFLFLATGTLAVAIAGKWNGIGVEEVIGQKALMPQLAAFDGLAKLLLMAGLLGYLSIRYRHRLADFGLIGSRIADGCRMGLAGFAMLAPPVWGLQWTLTRFIEYRHESLTALQDNPTALEVGMIWFGTILVAPVVEEFLFRGVVQGWLQRLSANGQLTSLDSLLFGVPPRQNRREQSEKDSSSAVGRYHFPSIVITSALFGLAHFSNGPAPITLFVFSLGLGYLYQRTGNLVACMVTHMLLNLVTIAASTAMAWGY